MDFSTLVKEQLELEKYIEISANKYSSFRKKSKIKDQTLWRIDYQGTFWPTLVKIHQNVYTLSIRQRKKVEEPTAKLGTKIDQPPIRNTAKQGNCYKLTS